MDEVGSLGARPAVSCQRLGLDPDRDGTPTLDRLRPAQGAGCRLSEPDRPRPVDFAHRLHRCVRLIGGCDGLPDEENRPGRTRRGHP